MKPVYDYVSKSKVVLSIASQEEIINDYGSIENFKQFIKEKYQGIIRNTADYMMKLSGGIQPIIMLMVKPVGPAQLDFSMNVINIDYLMEDETSKKSIHHVLRHIIHRDMQGGNEKIYGLLLFSEAWMATRDMRDDKEVEIEIMPSKDPNRREAVVVNADFIFGSVLAIYEIVRPANKPPYLQDTEYDFEFNQSAESRGNMYGLLRKTAGIWNPDHKIKFK